MMSVVCRNLWREPPQFGAVSSRTIYVGAHVSAAGGVENAPRNAKEIGASAFALFTRNQRRWESKPYAAETVTAFHAAMQECAYTANQVIPHASYLINLGSPSNETREKSVLALADELSRTVALGLRMLNFHPGTSKGEFDEQATLKRIAEGVDEVLKRVEGGVLVLENTAGQGSSMGRSIEQLARIIGFVREPERVEICIDTCHAFAAGYDVRSAGGWDALLSEVSSTIGLDKLAALHLNDSLGGLGSTKDRHQPLGEGQIGNEGFAAIMADSRIDGKPIVLETPRAELWPREIEQLRRWAAV